MKSEWRVSSDVINGVKMYAVYRLRNENAPDHSGNREYFGGYVEYKGAAMGMAARLNAAEED